MYIELKEQKQLDGKEVLDLYKQNKWSSAGKPDELIKALQNSHSVISAWHNNLLVGLANALSDGYLVVYYPHLLILPEYQSKGIGTKIMKKMSEKYVGFHQQILVADVDAIGFYEKCGFEPAGKCMPMWIYKGSDHE